MKHRLFLFDLDDTLLDFRASERLSFTRTIEALGLDGAALNPDALFADYQTINLALWKAFELGTVTKDFLKVERFRKAFETHGIERDPQAASALYLDALADTVVLIDGAVELCAALAARGEVGIVTNGVHQIQSRRIASSGLDQYVSFVATSEACGFAKPDVRFFEYATGMAQRFVREETVIVGDRLDADILGANRFGIESCWFNPDRSENNSHAVPDCEAASLQEVIPALQGLVPA